MLALLVFFQTLVAQAGPGLGARAQSSAPYAAAGAVTSLAASAPGAATNDPWYRDLAGHWARPYVRVLWEEEVADGYVYPSGRSYFWPNRLCDRAQFLLLLAKAFQLEPFEPPVPSYPDVGPSFTILNGKKIWAYVEACVRAGISFVPPGRNLFPNAEVTREDAVEFLVRCLDLWPMAQLIPEDEARRILSRFTDGHTTSRERLKSMALSVRLGIVQGCGDGTLQPRRPMMRCEMATIVYKSCLVRAQAHPPWFSPDGDGVDETVEFEFTWLKNRNIVSWNGGITDATGQTVFTFNPGQAPGPPPRRSAWGGTDSSGRPLPAGQYFYQLWVKDRLGNQFFSVRKPLYLVKHFLTARLHPEIAADGDTVFVLAETRPAALAVTATFICGRTVPLESAPGAQSWTATLEMGPWLPVGKQPVEVRAVFPGAVREETLYLTRLDPLTITAEVRPNPASRGQTVLLLAYTGTGVEAVTATLFGETIAMRPDGPTRWLGESKVPITAPVGPNDVLFSAFADGRRKDCIVILTVEESPLVNLTFILSE
ncbi:MAG: S-layer homology domain-containing protein [Firmicutes bacterium]|nr:S-layer homology domain-containing protein [Candidatus Fermentithermobacillaceae bacterium]